MCPPPRSLKRFKGFTLAELLIALLILGEIATFIIPKILSNQQNSSYNAIAKETISMFSEAYQQHKLNGQLSANTYSKDLMPYMNYVSVDTSGTLMDARPNWSSNSMACSTSQPCLKLHNGAVLHLFDYRFGGTTSLNLIGFTIDPDGVYTGKTDSLTVIIYYNGRITDLNSCLAGSSAVTSGGGSVGGCPITNGNPAWFSW